MIDWILAGFPRCGSTWLTSKLIQHPSIAIQEGGVFEEVNYFASRNTYDKGMIWYRDQFPVEDDKMVGDYSARYVQSEYCLMSNHNLNPPKMIHEQFGSVPVIVCVREPIDRMESQINHWIDHEFFPEDLDMDDLMHKKEWFPRKLLLLSMGRYMTAINRFRDYWPDERLHVHVLEEDTAKNPRYGVIDCFEFLGLSDVINVELDGLIEPKNHREHEWTIPEEWKEYLIDLFEKPNERLFDYLGRDIPERWEYGG